MQEQIFKNKLVSEPGVYSDTKSGAKNPPISTDYGTVLLIDLGGDTLGAGQSYKIGSTSYKPVFFDDIESFRQEVRAGMFSQAAEFLFTPGEFGIPGASKVGYIKAATSVQAAIALTLTASDIAISIKTRPNVSALGANGVLSTDLSKLLAGFAFKLKAGSAALSFVAECYASAYGGDDPTNVGQAYYGDYKDIVQDYEVIATSPDLFTLGDLYDWFTSNSAVNKYFSWETTGLSDVQKALILAPSDASSSFILFSGATTTYNATDLDNLLDYIQDLDYNYILTDMTGATNGVGTQITKVFAHLVTDAKFDKFLAVGSTDTVADSLAIAAYYNHGKANVFHGTFNKKINGVNKKYLGLAKAAIMLGRIVGLPPQIPGTFKKVAFSSENITLSEKERVSLLKGGVCHTKYDADFGGFIINQSINSLQKNKNFINDDGQSYEISVMRIAAQLNKGIVVNAKLKFFGNELGSNRFTMSDATIGEFLKDYLQRQTVSDTQDNLITYFEQILVKTVGDSKYVSYRFEPNFPVNKIFSTGFMLDTTLNQ